MKAERFVGTFMKSLKTQTGHQPMSMEQFHALVKNGTYRTQVEAIRQAMARQASEEEVRALKDRLPVWVAAGVFQGRRLLQNLQQFTGLMPVDIDHISATRAREIVSQCQQYPWIKAAHVSVRGEGVHMFVVTKFINRLKDAESQSRRDTESREAQTVVGSRLSVDRYKQVYAEVCREVERVFGEKVDGQCKDALRVMFVSYDPEAFIRDDDSVVLFDCSPLSVVKEDEINRRLISSYLPHHKYKPSERHNWWINFAQHLKRRHITTNMLPAYKDAMKQHLLKKGLILNDDPLLRSESEVTEAMQWGYEHSEEKEERETKVALVQKFLEKYQLRYDIISRKPQQKKDDGLWHEMTDRDINSLWKACCNQCNENISLSTTFRPVLMSDSIPQVNPLEEYVTQLPAWDPSQPDYIAQVAGMVHCTACNELDNGQLFTHCFRKWFTAMVASWLKPGVTNQQVLVLIGEQGIFKTSWIDALIPPQLVRYRSKQSATDRLDKDEQLRCAEYGLINLDEIDRLSERELNALKSLVTTPDVNVRAAYGYAKEQRRRIASYAASGNKENFLTDSTGNRRWLPFQIESIDSPYDNPLPYEGLYAQARYLVENEFNFWFSLEEIQQLTTHVDTFMVETSEEQLIPVYFDIAHPGQEGAIFLTTAELKARLTNLGNLKNPMEIRQLGQLLKKLGFNSVRMGHHSLRGFLVKEKSADVINAYRKMQAL
ncbi:MAG: hypothetical protein KBT15_01015 [Bacteroidales bacterium]|nr:hypothetical protein [Candidatus Minthousia equi]